MEPSLPAAATAIEAEFSLGPITARTLLFSDKCLSAWTPLRGSPSISMISVEMEKFFRFSISCVAS